MSFGKWLSEPVSDVCPMQSGSHDWIAFEINATEVHSARKQGKQAEAKK
jgi:hypothetical protein